MSFPYCSDGYQEDEEERDRRVRKALAEFSHLADRMRGKCSLCGHDDQRCTCWEDDA